MYVSNVAQTRIKLIFIQMNAVYRPLQCTHAQVSRRERRAFYLFLVTTNYRRRTYYYIASALLFRIRCTEYRYTTFFGPVVFVYCVVREYCAISVKSYFHNHIMDIPVPSLNNLGSFVFIARQHTAADARY